MPPLSPVTITLTKPVMDFGQPVNTLVISREMEVGDLIAMEEHEGKKTSRALILIQRLYRTPEGKEVLLESLRHMRPSDMRRLDKAMAPFADAGLPDGESSPAPSSSAANPSTP